MHQPKMNAKPVKAAPARRSLSQFIGIPIDALITPVQRQLQELVDMYPDQMRMCEPLKDGVEFFASDLCFAITVHMVDTTQHAWFVPVAKRVADGELLFMGRPSSSPQLALRQFPTSINAIMNIYAKFAKTAYAAPAVPDVPTLAKVPVDPKSPTFEI